VKFNTRIFSVALLPLYAYLLLFVYVLFRSRFHYEENTLITFGISLWLLAAAALISLRERKYHRLALLLYIGIGLLGIYSGLIADDTINIAQVIASAFVIAFGAAFYEMVEHHHEVWHEDD